MSTTATSMFLPCWKNKINVKVFKSLLSSFISCVSRINFLVLACWPFLQRWVGALSRCVRCFGIWTGRFCESEGFPSAAVNIWYHSRRVECKGKGREVMAWLTAGPAFGSLMQIGSWPRGHPKDLRTHWPIEEKPAHPWTKTVSRGEYLRRAVWGGSQNPQTWCWVAKSSMQGVNEGCPVSNKPAEGLLLHKSQPQASDS